MYSIIYSTKKIQEFLFKLHYFMSCYFKKSTVHIPLRLTIGKYHIDCKKMSLCISSLKK